MMPIEDIKHEIEQCKKHIARIEGWIAEPCMSSNIPKNDKALARELTLLGNLEGQLFAAQSFGKIVTNEDELVPPDFSYLLEAPDHSIEFVGGPMDGEYCYDDSELICNGDTYYGTDGCVYSLNEDTGTLVYVKCS